MAMAAVRSDSLCPCPVSCCLNYSARRGAKAKQKLAVGLVGALRAAWAGHHEAIDHWGVTPREGMVSGGGVGEKGWRCPPLRRDLRRVAMNFPWCAGAGRGLAAGGALVPPASGVACHLGLSADLDGTRGGHKHSTSQQKAKHARVGRLAFGPRSRAISRPPPPLAALAAR